MWFSVSRISLPVKNFSILKDCPAYWYNKGEYVGKKWIYCQTSFNECWGRMRKKSEREREKGEPVFAWGAGDKILATLVSSSL